MKQLNFQYIKTYSGFRGKLFIEQTNRIESEIKQLEKHFKTTINFKERYRIKHKIKHLKTDLKKLDLYNNRLIDTQNHLHEWTEEIIIIPKDNKISNQIISILTYERVEAPFVVTTSPPVFRDAIVFFKENQIIKIIYCCFECIRFIDEKDNEIYLSVKGITDLKILLINIGHQI